jgi:molybdenum cofactor cytidylyltransferase
MSVAAIVLAAGLSRRFGEQDKLLAKIDGEPLIRRAARLALRSRCERVHLVTRAGAHELEAALLGLPVVCCANPDFTSGIGSTIAVGIASLPSDVAGALILPADMPWMDAALLDRLIASFETTGATAVTYPVTTTGEQRNPVIWPRSFFPALRELTTDSGAKGLIPSTPGRRIEVEVAREEVFRDVDEPGDLPR